MWPLLLVHGNDKYLTNNMTKDLTILDGLDKKGMQTLIAYVNAKSTQEAADSLGITRQALWLRIKKYNLDKLITEIPKQAIARLQIGSVLAADKLIEKLDSRTESLDAAVEILDRVGVGNKGPVVAIQNNMSMGLLIDDYDRTEGSED